MLIDFSNIDFDHMKETKEIPQYVLDVRFHLGQLIDDFITIHSENYFASDPSESRECIVQFRENVFHGAYGFEVGKIQTPVEGSEIKIPGNDGESYENTINNIYYYGNNLHLCIPRLIENIRESDPYYTFDVAFPGDIEELAEEIVVEDFTGREEESFIFSDELQAELKHLNEQARSNIEYYERKLISIEDEVNLLREYREKFESLEKLDEFESQELRVKSTYVWNYIEIIQDIYDEEMLLSRIRRNTKPTQVLKYWSPLTCYKIGKFLYTKHDLFGEIDAEECIPYSAPGVDIGKPDHIEEEEKFQTFLFSKMYDLTDLRKSAIVVSY